MAKDKREKYYRELAGLRVVSMYVQEYFHWGWQQLDQENDDGIDGYVIIRDVAGRDLGCNIRVQIKSGPSFLKGRPNEGKHVKIQPYSPTQNLVSHMEDYKKSVLPVIMVWVNTQKERMDGTTYEDLRNPEAWWERMDDYQYNGESQITLTHKLGEHSKGDWFDTVKPILKSWTNHPLIELDKNDKKLYNSLHPDADAKIFYMDWQARETVVDLGMGKNLKVRKTRVGWRHINYKRRGSYRINNSLRLLSVAERIIGNNEVAPIVLDFEKVSRNGWIVKYGLRARVKIKKDEVKKVQVVLLRKINKAKGLDECEFFSVHVV